MANDSGRAARYVGDGTLMIDSVRVAVPAAGQVQISVAYCGICGTDLHILRGHMDSRVVTPCVLGHEASGRILSLGEDVSGWSVGDPVTVMPLRWDGNCPACVAGNSHICQNLDFVGIDSPGALQDRWNVDATLLVRLPEAMDLRDAALVEPTAVAVHDVRRSGLVRGERAVVIGGGPIGVLVASVARAQGAEVAIVELDDGRRAAAAELGFMTLDPNGDVDGWIDEWTSSAGADVVFEVSGAAAALLAATGYLRVRGRLVVVAIHAQPRPVDLHRVFWRELTIIGARVYERRDFEEAVKLVSSGHVPTQSLITGVVPLSEVTGAFAALEQGDGMKVLVDLQDGRK